MSEVSSWSNTDAGNNLTPPDGWPEGMQPSGVNDCGRMMMGAIKRWYDTVTAGIANAMPISGGTFTGAIVAPGITSTGNIDATDIGGRNLYVQNVTAAVDISASRDITATRNVNGAFVYSSGDMNAAGNITANNGFYGNYIHSNGNIVADSQVGAATLNVSSTATVGGNVTAGGVYSNGVVSAVSSVSAQSANITDSIACNLIVANAYVNTVTYQLGGANFSTRGSDAAGAYNAIYDGAGGAAFVAYGPGGSYYRCDNAHFFTNRTATLNICRFQAGDGNCINASGLWNSVSDASTKDADSIEPYRAGLAAALRLNTVSFRYMPGANPFAIDGQTYYGLVAQDVERVVPEMVGRTDDGLATVASGHLVFVLLNAVKELEARLAQVENRGG